MEPLVFRAAHLDRGSARTIVAPMALATVEPFARTATVAHENIGVFLFVAGMNRHDFLFEILPVAGRLLPPAIPPITRFAADVA